MLDGPADARRVDWVYEDEKVSGPSKFDKKEAAKAKLQPAKNTRGWNSKDKSEAGSS